MNKISIIVPIYNVEKYLTQCLESLVNQTFPPIEIICIDDASTDTSGKILDKYAKADARVKAVHLEENAGTLCARMKGMEMATGQFIMFLDSDDHLELNACEMLYQQIVLQNADILHFGTALHAGENVSAEMVLWNEAFLEPYHGLIEGNLDRECFVLDRFDVKITNKMVRREVCGQAFAFMEKRRLIAAEDRYMLFLILYFAKSYYGIRDKYCHYNLGIGVTGGDVLSLEQFEKRCTGAMATELVRQFLGRAGADASVYQEIADQFGKKILWDCVDCWHNKLVPADYGKGFGILASYFGPDEIVAAAARAYSRQEEEICSRVGFAHKKRVAVYDRYLGTDAAKDRELVAYAGRLARRGYDVLLYTDEEQRKIMPDAAQYGLPVIVLPDSRGAEGDKYEIRANALYAQLLKDKIGVLLYASPSSHIQWLDILLCRLAEIDVFDMQDELYPYRRMEQLKRDNDAMALRLSELELQFGSPRAMFGKFLDSCRKRLWKRKGSGKNNHKTISTLF